ncbi:hypothetical protein MP228_006154 [Amoeboaphelidium protococcarum]|nr:hypothetical protein MP228_006154 [Amoeboaphelidium protococcarum]
MNVKRRPGRPRKYFKSEEPGDDDVEVVQQKQEEEEMSDDDGDGEDALQRIKITPKLAAEIWDDEFSGDGRVDENGDIVEPEKKEFRIRTFILRRRDANRKYCLVLDMARLVFGIDSHRFLRANPDFKRLILSVKERDDMIKMQIIHPNMRQRNVAVTSVVNAYKLYGGKLIRKILKEGDRTAQDQTEIEDLKSFHSNVGQLSGLLKDPSPVQQPGQDWIYQIAKSTFAYNQKLKLDREQRLNGGASAQQDAQLQQHLQSITSQIAKRKRRSSSRESDDISDLNDDQVATASGDGSMTLVEQDQIAEGYGRGSSRRRVNYAEQSIDIDDDDEDDDDDQMGDEESSLLYDDEDDSEDSDSGGGGAQRRKSRGRGREKQRLSSQRPPVDFPRKPQPQQSQFGYYDPHTNIMLVPRDVCITNVQVHTLPITKSDLESGKTSNVHAIDKNMVIAGGTVNQNAFERATLNVPHWIASKMQQASKKSHLYPLALQNGQYQSNVSIFNRRFGQQ